MKIIHVDSSQGDIKQFNDYLNQGKPIFVLFYMEGCGPCNATRPEWAKLENILKDKYRNNDFIVADIDQELISQIPNMVSPSGFPSMKYIKGSQVEDYEDSSIDLKDRTIDSFVQWIKSKIPSSQKGGKRNTIKTRKTRKYKKKGGKWTLKYKKSINCRRPKGFSQRQYCKYGRNKK
jgi:thiol-disulfide isomerase/thioredoxin